MEDASLRAILHTNPSFYSSSVRLSATAVQGTVTRTVSGSPVSQCGWTVPAVSFVRQYVTSSIGSPRSTHATWMARALSMSSACAHPPALDFLPARFVWSSSDVRWLWSPRGAGDGTGPLGSTWYAPVWTSSYCGGFSLEYRLGHLASPQTVSFSF